MGTFEKLGVLVIVVIIVMILAVAIYQWGGPGVDPVGPGLEVGGAETPELTIRTFDELEKAKRGNAPAPEPESVESWPGGIPREYVVQANDSVWKLVVELWKLRAEFVDAITRANPKIDTKRLQPGQRLSIPDPQPFVRGAKKTPPNADGVRTYEIQVGDSLETIARTHLGTKNRWPEILKLNSGLKPKSLKPGHVIRIPAK